MMPVQETEYPPPDVAGVHHDGNLSTMRSGRLMRDQAMNTTPSTSVSLEPVSTLEPISAVVEDGIDESVRETVVETERRCLDPKKIKYQRLPRIDQAHAETLEQSCRMSPEAERLSKVLARRALRQSVLTSLPLLATDFVVIWGLLMVVTTTIERLFGLPRNLVTRESALVASLLMLPIARMAGLYPALGTGAAVEFRQLVQSAATALYIFAGIGIVANTSSWLYFVCSSLLTLALIVPLLPAARFSVRCMAAKWNWWGAPVVIYGSAPVAEQMYRRLQFMRERGLRPAAVLLSSDEYWSEGPRLEEKGIPAFDVRTALDCVQRFQATWVLIGNTGLDGDDSWSNAPEFDSDLNAVPHRVLLSSGAFDCGMWDRAHTIGTTCGLLLSNNRHCGSRAFVKRILDVAITLAVFVFASPVLIGIAIAIRLSSPGPIFYSQKRIGLGGKTFAAWKFRSMVPDADRVLQQHLDSDPELRKEWEQTHKLKNDPRITWIGRLIRSTSLDELPQLWNILYGEMSWVGPRPIVNSPTYDATYVNDYPNEYAAYISMRPGLTGLWQVTCRNSGVYELRIYWDMYYIRNWSLWLDLYIMLRTVRTVLLREGAY